MTAAARREGHGDGETQPRAATDVRQQAGEKREGRTIENGLEHKDPRFFYLSHGAMVVDRRRLSPCQESVRDGGWPDDDFRTI
jgi:hypothetical protein